MWKTDLRQLGSMVTPVKTLKPQAELVTKRVANASIHNFNAYTIKDVEDEVSKKWMKSRDPVRLDW